MSKIIDQTENKDLLKKLEEFGLSAKESQVYLALLPRRDVGSSKIIAATGLHKQFVYNALVRLEELGLAKHVMRKNRKKFSANTPTRIISILEEKKLSAQTMVRQLQERFIGAHEQDFEILQGEASFIAYQFALLERTSSGGMINVITGPNDQYYKILTEAGVAEEFERVRIEKNLSVRYLGSETKRSDLAEMEMWRKLWTHKILPGLSTGVVDITAWPNSVVINLYGNPLLSFVITGEQAAAGYREFFEALWKLGA